jgi:mono/diheme cytochrome c family protein
VRVHGFSARAEPAAFEEFLAERLRRLSVAAKDRDLKNPVTPNDAVLADARAHFADHCAICHGNDGRGETEIGQGLYPKAPNMREDDTQKLTDGELFYIIENGVKLTGMPAWGTGSPESEQDSWHLVHFIRHLPQLTEDELDEMADLNPRGLADWRALEEERRFLAGESDAPAVTKPPIHKGHHP